MPQLALTMEQGCVVRWQVRAGDAIAKGQQMFTDKAVSS
jgi:pyruvate/2-oxoglutarate dehydrogenase complex dihydrolipoamide acyltransferase (E2) component